ncbi:TipJ family phage tail tip protein [Providencia stuartii]|uniref:phage tail protein n=1 Tax=Providencia stuartii TaxID=588 RepID=UPI003F692DCA
METIYGAKGGGGGGHTPVESPDSLLAESTAKILLAISEGEIAGGLDDTRIFLDDTPIGNADGSKNFEGVTWEFRAGSEHQEYIQGIPSVDNEIAVGMELKDDQPYIRSINNTQLSAVRIRFSAPQFMQQHDNGDTTGYRVDYIIELSTDGSGYKEVIKSAFDGKTTSEYQRTHRIELPKANTGWQLRVRRLTKNQNTARIADKVTIAAVTEVIDAKLRYPNTALLFITFNARQFNNRIPKISVRPKGGLLIKVPTNYDPINRTYSGVWDGTFKLAATNNPAWVFYDLVLNNRYGCGDRINASQIDKWDLYKIAQYCDELVPDGRGGDGKEPRFLCDVYIQSQEAAYTVLRDIAAIFRGMTYWSDNKINVVADMPEPVFRVFTNANIVGGKPTYSGGSIQNRYTQALVSFTDIDNHSNDDVEAVADLKLQHRYGVRKTELSAIGCTRRSEANRRGRWALLTNANDRMVTFATGLEGAIPSPGHIIGLADSTLAGRSTGGRIFSVDGRKITLDRTTSIKVGDRLIVNLPDGKSEGRTVTSVNQKVVTVSVEYSQVPQKEAVWVVDSDDLAIQLYRVINISDNGDNTYTISGAIHNPDNYEHIDAGARIDERPITVIPPKVQPAPKNVRISSYTQVDQGIAFTTLRVDWEAAESAIAYEAEWRRDNGNWINAPRTSTLGFEVNGIYAGRYQVRVRAINASEISSVWANAEETQLNGKEGNPPKPLNLRATSEVWGITLNWGFDANTSDTLKTELQYSSENTVESMQLLADVPYPLKSYRMSGLKAGVRFYFRARLVDKSGNQSEWTNVVLGESSTDVVGILDAVGDTFLTTEAGKQMQEQIDFSKEAIAELELDTIDVKQKVVSIDRDVEAVNEAVMMNTQFTTEVHFSLKEEVADRKAEIFRIEQVQVTDREAAARWQEQITAKVDYNASEILNIKDAQSSYGKATAQQISQVKADVDGVKSRVTTVETATADLKQSQAKFEQSTTAEFGEMRGYITHFETSLSNVELAVSEAIMQTTAQVNQHSSELLQSKADVKRIANATATNEKATAELAESVKAHYEDSQAEFVDVRKSIAEQDKAHSERTEQVRAELGKDINANKEEIDKTNKELSDISAAVTTNTKAIAETDKTLTELQQVSSSRFDSNEATIANIQNTQANAESSQAETTLQLAAQQNEQGSELLRAKASIRETNKIIVDNDKAYAQKFTQIDAQLGENGARFTRVEEALADTQQSVAKSHEQLNAKFDSRINTVQAQIDTQKEAIAKQDQAIAKVNTDLSTRIGQAESSISDNKQSISDNEQALADFSQLTRAEFDNQQAAIEQRGQTIFDHNGNGSAIYTIKTGINWNNQYYDAKFMMGAEVRNGKVVTQIGFSADTFGIFNPSSGKLEPVFFVENGQVFINEAFINQATIEKLLIGSTIKSKNWDPSAKKGLMLDFENGKLIANDAEITGKIYATDGEFNGTVYVEKLIGDNAVAATYKYATKEEIHGSKYDQVIESKIIYTGGMPYDVDLLMPTMQFESAGSYSDAIIDAYVQIIIDGVTHTPQTTKVINGSSWKLVCSFYATIPASKKDVVVTVRYTTYHAGKCTTKILPAMVIACKHNSSSFKIS